MPQDFDAQALYTLLLAHKWWAVAAVVIGVLVRLTKDDRFVAWFPVTVASRWRPLVAVGLGVASGVLEALAAGTAWPVALLGGVGSAIAAMSAHAVVISSVRNGRELGVPKAEAPAVAPSPPPSIKPPPAPPVVIGAFLV